MKRLAAPIELPHISELCADFPQREPHAVFQAPVMQALHQVHGVRQCVSVSLAVLWTRASPPVGYALRVRAGYRFSKSRRHLKNVADEPCTCWRHE